MTATRAGIILAAWLAGWTTGGSVAASDPGPRIRGRLQTRIGARENRKGEWESRLELRRARVDGRWDAFEWLRLVIELDGAERLRVGEQLDWAVRLVDAYGRLEFHPALRLSLGYFKKPFSRLKMTSAWDLLLPFRGMLNGLAIARSSHGGYGGRDVGLMFSGTFAGRFKIRYYLGVFQGPGFVDGSEERHQDFVARCQARLLKGLVFGINASHKLFDAGGIRRTVNLFGADIRWRFGDLTVQLEGAFGDNVEALPGHELIGGHALIAYRIGLGEDWALTPAVTLEGVEPDLSVDWGQALRLAGALNLDFKNALRFTVYAEGRLATGFYEPALAENSDVGGRNRIFVQVNWTP